MKIIHNERYYDHSPEAIKKANERWLKRGKKKSNYKPNISMFFHDAKVLKKMKRNRCDQES